MRLGNYGLPAETYLNGSVNVSTITAKRLRILPLIPTPHVGTFYISVFVAFDVEMLATIWWSLRIIFMPIYEIASPPAEVAPNK